MIHRKNWIDVCDYIKYTDHVKQRDPKTIHKYRGQLRHLLEWADDQPLPRGRAIEPSLPSYLVTRRSLREPDKTLSPVTITKTLQTVRDFYSFARLEWPQRYQTVTLSWIEYLQPPRSARLSARVVEHQFYPLEDVRRLLAVSAETLREERAQTAAAMLFLSAMRPDTLASIPISCVDLPNRTIYQLPERGVRTKNHKAAITYLLDLPDLFEVVQAWDRRVRGFAPTSLWYSPIALNDLGLKETSVAILGRASVIGEDLRPLCERAGVEYRTPHKLRHGHAVYALKQAQTIADLKAISQNMMHESVTITDQVYGKFTHDDVKSQIAKLGTSTPEIGDQLTKLLALLGEAKAKNLF
jgi:integrase